MDGLRRAGEPACEQGNEQGLPLPRAHVSGKCIFVLTTAADSQAHRRIPPASPPARPCACLQEPPWELRPLGTPFRKPRPLFSRGAEIARGRGDFWEVWFCWRRQGVPPGTRVRAAAKSENAALLWAPPSARPAGVSGQVAEFSVLEAGKTLGSAVPVRAATIVCSSGPAHPVRGLGHAWVPGERPADLRLTAPGAGHSPQTSLYPPCELVGPSLSGPLSVPGTSGGRFPHRAREQERGE